jgi:hypothetical protein
LVAAPLIAPVFAAFAPVFAAKYVDVDLDQRFREPKVAMIDLR